MLSCRSHVDPLPLTLSDETCFYNKVQVFNRDTSCQVIRLFADERRKEWEERGVKRASKQAAAGGEVTEQLPFPGLHVLDALAATGLRSVRYLKEIPGVSHVTINDLDPAATEQAAQNIARNGVDLSRATIETGDATMLM